MVKAKKKYKTQKQSIYRLIVGHKLTSSCKAHCPHRDQRLGTIVEGQIDGEHDITSITIQVHGEIDQVRRCGHLRLHPADL
jgi:hypothetical protein